MRRCGDQDQAAQSCLVTSCRPSRPLEPPCLRWVLDPAVPADGPSSLHPTQDTSLCSWPARLPVLPPPGSPPGSAPPLCDPGQAHGPLEPGSVTELRAQFLRPSEAVNEGAPTLTPGPFRVGTRSVGVRSTGITVHFQGRDSGTHSLVAACRTPHFTWAVGTQVMVTTRQQQQPH